MLQVEHSISTRGLAPLSTRLDKHNSISTRQPLFVFTLYRTRAHYLAHPTSHHETP